MRQNENYILNYNSNNRKFRSNWEKLFSQLGKKHSLTGAQNLRSKAIFRTFLLLLLMLASNIVVWAQEDYSGTYYIASDYQKKINNVLVNQYDHVDLANNFYLCPTEGWAFFKAPNGVQADDNGAPFITTHKKSSEEAAKYRWIIEKHTIGGVDYYTFKYGVDYVNGESTYSRYLSYNPQLSGAGVDRMRVHLEKTENPGDNELFRIVKQGTYLVISPKKTDEYESDANHKTKYLTVNAGNVDNYVGNSGKVNGPTGYVNTKGIVGTYWDITDVNAPFYLEDVIERPTISYNTSNLIEITHPTAGATIYYTTDGTTPSSTNGTEYSTPFDPADGVTTIKAVAIINEEATNVTTFTPPVLLGSNHTRLIQNQANPWDTDFHFYMIPGDPSNDITKVNTTSLFRPTMEWYFESAGIEDGVQYYYIVNPTTSKNLCYDGTNEVYMDTKTTTDNKFKFRITESTTAGNYNIIPYGETQFINKTEGNASNNAVDLTSSNSEESQWRFVLPTSLDKTAPFTAVTPSSTKYYKIENIGHRGNYIVPPTSPATFVTTSNSTTNTMNWYFEVAQEATDDDWLTYYYVRNATTGDYLYFPNEQNNNQYRLEMRSSKVDDDDHYLFTWARTALDNQYYIVPKLNTEYNRIRSFQLSEVGAALIVNYTRSAGELAWVFEESTTFKCATPEISFNGTTGFVISPTESDAKIKYTTDNGDTWNDYTSGDVIPTPSSPLTIKAYAYRSGDESDKSTEASITVERVAAPTMTFTADGKVQLNCATDGAQIYYVLGESEPSDPTTSSTLYEGPFEGAVGKYIKAFAVKGGMINSTVFTNSNQKIKFTCATPDIRRTSNNTITIECSFPTTGVTIYYTLGENNTTAPTPSTGTYIAAGGTISGVSFPTTVRAIAVADGDNYNNSEIAIKTLTAGLDVDGDVYLIKNEADLAEFATMVKANKDGEGASAHYRLTANVSGSGIAEITESTEYPFSGIFEAGHDDDGNFYTITGLTHALFNKIDGGTVKNVMLDNVNITTGTNVGAIANVVEGTADHIASIYNCGVLSGSVSGSGDVGSIVGLLGNTGNTDEDKAKCYARVINCFSFATVSGGTNTGGIVGNNAYASKSGDIRTMVMNCMFYGTNSGSKIYPIYGGLEISNRKDNDVDSKLNNYNYFCYEKLSTANIAGYNCALAAEERYLVRFEFYRNLLNSTRELAAWYATGSTANAHSKMAKWVLDKSIAPYPILKKQGKYPSVVNYEVAPTSGTLSVTINRGSDAPDGATVSSKSLPIYDKDPANHHYNYRTVRLPYFHEVGTGNYAPVSGKNYYKAVTGWKITGMTGGTQGTFTAADEWDGYNFADRAHYAKDLYSQSGRVFSQGAYFDVPDGVTGITIEPYWGNAVFLSDPYYDKYGYAEAETGDVEDFGLRYNNGSTYTLGNHSLKVYTTIGNALNQLTSSSNVYDNVVVLVGNYHHNNSGDNEISDGSKGAFTITSIDLNEDNEPDYSLIYRSGKQKKLAPIRFDFINVPGAAMAHKTASSKNMGIPGNAKLTGWFEVTNTALIHYSQFEYDSEFKGGSHPVILLGGVFEQIVSTNGGEGCLDNKTTKYIHVGSNVWFKLFNNGCHLDKTSTKTPRIPISVTGGDYDKFYLSGYFQPEAPVFADDAECYISGGHFGELAGAGQEPIDGNVQWLIDHADIDNFYGGGINDKKPITGNITVTIKDSKVGTYCGGPKFGNMNSEKAVTTTATGCTFDNFYGAGFGGTSLYRYLWNGKKNHNQYESVNYEWNGTTWVGHTTYGFTSGTRGKYVNGQGILVSYDYEHFEGSSTNTVARLYMLYASLSLAQTKDVTSSLTGCTINQNFYGGGKLGSVDGNITSTLTNCTVKGNAYGAGYSGNPPSVEVFGTDGTNAGGFQTIPNYNTTTGVFEKGVYPDGVKYTWSDKGSVTNNSNSGSLTDDSEGHWIHTDVDLTTLGTVTGKVTLTIDGTTSVTGDVYGGGAQSDAEGDVEVNVKSGSMADVYGGGEGESTVVGGTVTVNVGAESEGTYSGPRAVNVYGGSAFGAVNATKTISGSTTTLSQTADKTTDVNVLAGTLSGSVYGGGEGNATTQAKVYGNTTVTIGAAANDANPTIEGSVYGGSNINGVSENDVTVTIINGTIGKETNNVVEGGNVHGGGEGQLTLVKGSVEVNMGEKTGTASPYTYSGNATVRGDVYGGSALGNTNSYWQTQNNTSVLTSTTGANTTVNLYKGTVKGSVYGGALGQQGAGEDNIPAIVGGNVTVELNNGVPDTEKGCVVKHNIFGCNNANGTPKGNVTVHVYKTQNAAAGHITNQDGDTNEDTKPKKTGRYDVAAVYGGGNQAAYNPTKATGSDADKAEAHTTVIIDGCDRTSIEYVYGGGNAAPVPATDVTINSSFEIYNVFGGGNGYGFMDPPTNSIPNPGADVGIINKTEYDTDHSTGIYGTGIAETKLFGGTINTVYGGSNTRGNVVGGTSVSMPSKNEDCPLNVSAIYGAGKNAEQSGVATTTVSCSEGSKKIYGGAKDANVGGVNLIITGGSFDQVFGGNDTSGTIRGPINITIEETDDCELTIKELYLGGKLAPYSIYGYYNAGTPEAPDYQPRTPEIHAITDTEDANYKAPIGENPVPYNNPVLDVVSCTSIGKVFGGGLGSTAIMYGSPTVNLNMIPGNHATNGELGQIGKDYTDDFTDSEHPVNKTGGVFGGGNEAKVVGNTTINIGTETTVTMKSEKDATSNEYATHTVEGADIRSNVYGGGEEAEVTGNTQVNIRAKEVTVENNTVWQTVELAEGDVTIAGSVFGAGKGANDNVASAIVRGNSNIQMGGGWVKQNVYGGGELSCVGDFTFVTTAGDTKDDIDTYTAGGTSKVNIFAGTVGPATQDNPATYGHVFGAGQGNVSYPKFNYAQATDVTISGTAIVKGSVFGGSENGNVRGDTEVEIKGGTIGVQSIKKGGETVGNIYGGGKGTSGHPSSGIVKGNTNVSISGGTIYHNIYGGGAYGSVGTITLGTATYVPGNAPVDDMPTAWAANTGEATVTITGGTIGQDGDENGMIFGSSRGDVAAPIGTPAVDPNDKLAWVYDTEVTIGTEGSETGPTIFGSVYGSGENGHVFNNTDVKIHSGTIGVASGAQVVVHDPSDPDDPTKDTTYEADDYPYRGNVYGGGCGEDTYTSGDNKLYNPLAGIVLGNTNITITGGHVVHDVFGAGALGSVGNKATIDISGGQIGVDGDSDGNVYGAARGDLNSTQTNIAQVQETEVNILPNDIANKPDPVIWNDVFGGGKAGIVKGSVAVSVSGGEVKNDVYGGGALADTNTDNWDATKASYAYVVVTGLTVHKDAQDNQPAVTGSDVSTYYTKSDRTYSLTSDAEAQSGVTYYSRRDITGDFKTTPPIDGTKYYTTKVSLTGGKVSNAYGGGLGQWGTGVHYTSTECNTYNATLTGHKAASETLTAEEAAAYNVQLTDAIASGATLTSAQATAVNSALSLTGGDAYATDGTAVISEAHSIAYNATLHGALSTDALSADQANAYNATLKGARTTSDWEVHPSEGTGNVKAMVYGDVTVTVNKKDNDTYGTARFTIDSKEETYKKKVRNAQNVEQTVTEKGTVYTKGRVFGCNNINGTPKGDVTVTVWKTLPQEGDTHIYTEDGGSYEIQGVYGGGNLANYEPATGKQTEVNIRGCGETSIQYVFGGGNAARVPETHVNIFGTFEIESVFGGGNGNEPIYSEGTWVQSPGAEVMGDTNVELMAGLMHQAFGGSFEKGTIYGQTNIEKPGTGGEDCTLKITDIFGGGKDADVNSVNIELSECNMAGLQGVGAGTGEGQQIENVYAGSYNARILGDVTMTVKSGTFKNVFGGNYSGGFINGKITLNVEETSNCKPVKITNLYGGGNYAPYPGAGANNSDPKITINVKACTSIGNIYGGSYHADVTGDTEVNINMIKGWWAGKTYTPSGENAVSENIPDAIGTIGNVYGGGNLGRIVGNTVVNIGNLTEIDLVTTPEEDPNDDNKVPAQFTQNDNNKYDVLGAKITGNVYGGGNQADVTGYTIVNICATANASTHLYAAKVAEGTSGVTIDGTGWSYGVFGGGNKGKVHGNSYVNMGGGKVNQSVYGGGCEADVLGNTFVTMADGYVFDGIAGGGLEGSVGTFNTSTNVTDYGHTANHDGCTGKPISLKTANTGKCTVNITGGQVGPVDLALKDDAGGMNRPANQGGPVAEGWVWGGGRGVVEDPTTHPDTHFKTYVNETDVTISGTAFIVGSVIGGGEFGRVLTDTHVTIDGDCQIGVGEGEYNKDGEDHPTTPKPYDVAKFIDPTTTEVTNSNALAECSHFPYGENIGTEDAPNWVYKTYDPYADDAPTLYPGGSTNDASDGKSWIGCVFGGGSGYYPCVKAKSNNKVTDYDWVRSAGWVEGNTLLEIKGGHILTNVYGGNEYSDVGKKGVANTGKCTVKMSGGTIGVPRTLEQIAAHPLSCYLFGAGKGDPRSHFNGMTNVNSVEVEVSGGIIYGSVFGGAEDGHVLGDVKVDIKPGAKIGTWGTSYVDGNVFGGGRGFSGEELMAGNVGGTITMNITGGIMMGNIYGGGRLGSVGYEIENPKLADGETDNPDYGKMSTAATSGHTIITIDGTSDDVVIGNNHEFKYRAEGADRTTIPYTDIEYDSDRGYYLLNHTKGGNVFAGGMGRREKLDGVNTITAVDWHKLGNVKSSKLTIQGSKVWIKGNVYGGGEFGAVTGYHTTNSKQYGTEITITGGTIGTVIGSNINATVDNSFTASTGVGSGDTRYAFGSVYGGGYGTEEDVKATPYETNVEKLGAYVNSNTYISVSGASTKIRGSVYGGGEMAAVKGNTNVNVANGEIGVGEVRTTAGDNQGYVLFGSWRMGNVYGGGKGTENAVFSGIVQGNSNVNVSGGNIYHNVYGGGAYGSVGTYTLTVAPPQGYEEYVPIGGPSICAENTGTATVTITGGTIGINGWDNGMVNGSGRGDVSKPEAQSNGYSFDPYDRFAWVKNSVVTIGNEGSETVFTTPQPQIKGSVYGGGENGHNLENAIVNIYSGTIGTAASSRDTQGNVFGAGCGTDKYTGDDTKKHHNRSAGFVQGNVTMNIRGGHIINDVFGAGSMASAGGYDNKSTLNISGGQIDGSVYGGPKGDLDDEELKARAKATEVNILPGADVRGSVFGGGLAGVVEGSVVVNMTGGTVGEDLYGGGALADANISNWNEQANPIVWADSEKKTALYTTTVNLLGGTITGNAYGGALGRKEVKSGNTITTPAIEAKVLGDVKVNVNGVEAVDYNADKHGAITGDGARLESVNDGYRLKGSVKGTIVTNIFGCNNLNGSPKGDVTVHVFATQNKDSDKNTIGKKFGKPDADLSEITEADTRISTLQAILADQITIATALSLDVTAYASVSATENDLKEAIENITADINSAAEADATKAETLHGLRYDVQAVYGGGNLAAYEPYGPSAGYTNTGLNEDVKATEKKTKVIIEGCEYTSIYQAYGGGNAASTPATHLTINSAYEIYEVFGGGNGNDPYKKDDGTGTLKWYENPGANVGYYDYTAPDTSDEGKDGTTKAKAYPAVEKADATTPEARTKYKYGSGVAQTDVRGGTIRSVFGGSNKKGNISETAMSVYESSDDYCTLCVGETYGGGKEAPMDGDIVLTLDCVKDMPVIYGGSKDADVNANITLNITNGTFEKVFGGNNTSGAINGSITVNIEEKGCQPIFIKELYGGGYLAPYSIYGYQKTNGVYDTESVSYKDENGNTKSHSQRIPLTSGANPQKNPRINVISASRIDNIYGGGYQALVVGSPRINVNMQEGKINSDYREMYTNKPTDEPISVAANGETYTYTLKESTSADAAFNLAIGTIGNIFGGGDEAKIDGDTYLEIGTGQWINKDGDLETEDASGNKYTYKELKYTEEECITENAKLTGALNSTDALTEEQATTYNTAMSASKEAGNTLTAAEAAAYNATLSGAISTNDVKVQGKKWYNKDNVEETNLPTDGRKAAKITNNIYGGGNEGDVTGNTYITMENGSVENRIFGGGNLGHVGTFQKTNAGKPDTWNDNTGVCNVTITGGMVGPAGSPKMDPTDPTWDKGHVFGAGRGENPSADADNYGAYVYDTNVTIGGTAFVKGCVFGGSENGHVRHDTHVVIQDNCQIGCGQNTTERHPETVWAPDYTPTDDNNLECYSWPYAAPFAPYDPNALATGKYANNEESYGRPTGSDGHTFYGSVFGGGSGYYPYTDANEQSQWVEKAGEVEGDTYVTVTGGHILTSLYGGNEMTNVLGNTHVVMTGGTLGVPRTLAQIIAHPVTCYLFGSGKGDQRIFFNTQTNIENAYIYVLNKARIYGSVFGGGEDGHVHKNVDLNIGNELPTDLKNKIPVLKDVTSLPGTTTVGGVQYPLIGTKGISYVDGNVFGGGRGFSGDALTAGSVGGNVTVTIKGGTMLGSIYGGGRLGSVGIDFNAENDPTYGQFHEDAEEVRYKDGDVIPDGKQVGDIKTPAESHGHITVNISGGTIGNEEKSVTLNDKTYNYGGNVFGGCMGRLTYLDGSPNKDWWPRLAQAKSTVINITGEPKIKHSVYGGGEMGTVRDDVHVTVGGKRNADGTITHVATDKPTIEYNVFGGGYGSDIDVDTYESTIHAGATTYTFRPIEFAGCVGGDTHVNIYGGLVKRTVYGGGELATVGLVDLTKSKAQRNNDEANSFRLSWPYNYAYVQETGGTAYVTITGDARIGLSGKDKINSDEEEDNGDVFGGGKGDADDRYKRGFCGNVRNTVVTINVPDPEDNQIEIFDRTGKDKWTLRLKDTETGDKIPGIAGSVYGGAEDGHVIENTQVNIQNGYIGHAVYGGGKGKGTYLPEKASKEICANTAGKVYGNTNVNMTGGWVMRNIYGGGNLGSVGKGNYAGGADDYYPSGYGERITGNLWTTAFKSNLPESEENPKDNAWYFLNSGKATVNVIGGKVGYMISASEFAGNNKKLSVCKKDDLPTGNVFGGCRGQAATEELRPTFEDNPDFFLGYVNRTEVNIGDANETTGPIILGSVYGGGQDGHVRHETKVTINKGEIGVPYNADYKAIFGEELKDSEGKENMHWLNRGNVYGSGSGIGTYESNEMDANNKPIKKFSSSAGSVTRNTNVTVNSTITGKAATGGVIYRNVYGGGSMASVGPPLIGTTVLATKDQSLCYVTIDGAVGTTDEAVYVKDYGGEVYGAGRGETLDPTLYTNFADFASAIWTKVLLKKNADVMSNVFGGGDAGVVKKDSEVIVGE